LSIDVLNISLSLLKVLVLGWIIGVASSVFGLGLSYLYDLPTAPLIVASLSLTFFALLIFKYASSRADA